MNEINIYDIAGGNRTALVRGCLHTTTGVCPETFN